ncbi:dienelactone hydrolase family protein [Hydrogenophaga sp.]|uniref:dienelactone hydrolase family protein n=1 Tax=Hydrogenophaga sp. TaxID=1904254 RepID=UPI003F730CB1
MTAMRRAQEALFGITAIVAMPVAMAQTDQKVEVATIGQPLYPGASVPVRVPAVLRLPEGAGPFPAVVIVHGSAGVDGRGAALAEELRRAGIVSLELDMWKPRGLTGGTGSRPRIISDTLPDAWGAWAHLAADARVDPKRIGITGFSWGGAVAWITAFGLKPLGAPPGIREARFAAHVPFYGGCSSYLPSGKGGKALAALGVKPTGAPMLYVIGTKDDYEMSPDACNELAKAYPDAAMRVRLVEGATHGFDGPEYGRFHDPLARDSTGGHIVVRSDPESARIVRAEVASFLKAELNK